MVKNDVKYFPKANQNSSLALHGFFSYNKHHPTAQHPPVAVSFDHSPQLALSKKPDTSPPVDICPPMEVSPLVDLCPTVD